MGSPLSVVGGGGSGGVGMGERIERMTAAEAHRRYVEQRGQLRARMPEGSGFHWVTAERDDDAATITFDAGWGSCTLDRCESVEVQL